MKVSFRQSGGFAGLIRGCELDTDAMSPAQAQELERLVHASRLAEETPVLADKSRDLQQYEITIDKGDSRASVTFDDSHIPESLRALLKVLKQNAKPQRLA